MHIGVFYCLFTIVYFGILGPSLQLQKVCWDTVCILGDFVGYLTIFSRKATAVSHANFLNS